jgi:hypothetical protein
MSFAALRAVAHDEKQPSRARRRALRYAITSYSSLTLTSFESVWRELRSRQGIHCEWLAGGEAYGRAFTDLEAARAAFLASVDAFARLRRAEKRKGVRRPRTSQLRELYRRAPLGRPLKGSPAHEES